MESVCLWHPATLIWDVLTTMQVALRGRGEMTLWSSSTGRAHAHFSPRTSWIHSRQALVTRYPLLFGSITGRITIWVTQEWANQQKYRYHFPHLLLQMPTVMPGPTRQKTKGRGTGGWACSALLCPGDFWSHSAWVCDELKYKWGRGLLNGVQNPWGLFWNNFLHNRSLSKIPLTNCNRTLIGMQSMIPSFFGHQDISCVFIFPIKKNLLTNQEKINQEQILKYTSHYVKEHFKNTYLSKEVIWLLKSLYSLFPRNLANYCLKPQCWS